ncbi:MAG: hypothetical protein AAFU49_09805 [Pseudomonadota bacterium]
MFHEEVQTSPDVREMACQISATDLLLREISGDRDVVAQTHLPYLDRTAAAVKDVDLEPYSHLVGEPAPAAGDRGLTRGRHRPTSTGAALALGQAHLVPVAVEAEGPEAVRDPERCGGADGRFARHVWKKLDHTHLYHETSYRDDSINPERVQYSPPKINRLRLRRFRGRTTCSMPA